MTPPPRLKDLLARVRRGTVDTVLVVFPDMQGRWMGKRVTGPYFADLVSREGVHVCDYLLTVDMEMEPVQGYAYASWKTGYGDVHLVPDWDTARVLPWLEKTALVVCDLEGPDGRPVEVSPRRVLRRQIERAAKAGFSVKLGSELELYLYRGDYEESRRRGWRGLEPLGGYVEDYHILQGSKEEFVVRDIRNHMEAARVPVEFSKGEWGPGQQEINLRYADALEMADRHAVYKNGAKEIAHFRGVSLTFMAKPHAERAGSSCHIHASLWDRAGRKPLFWSGKGPSKLFRSFLAGQLDCAAEFAVFFAPYVNSYKRYMAGSFAPTRLAWGRDNRTCGFRIVGEGPSHRIENRVPGADVNPYLAFAATIAAGLRGIEKGLEPPDETSGNAYELPGLPEVPKSLDEAVRRLEGSRAAKEAFGEEVVAHYLRAARAELEAQGRSVGSWELERYFEQG